MNTGYKRFKDPIYGYIKVNENIVKNIIDMPEFQRLRDVIQTSYVPLYSSALHNRFAHSLGVYHLGKIASQAVKQSFENGEQLNIDKDLLINLDKYIEVFELACLLHDVGHAPFSHTGEQFYLNADSREELHKELLGLFRDKNLKNEIKKNSYNAAPHEIMSSILALNIFKKSIPISLKSFFVRCITGYKHSEEMSRDKSLQNCLIELLNSKVIDVDKLDYLMRDSYMSGFDTVRIDYVRLLDSICVINDEKGFYKLCYHKAAVSILENVVYAHDAERKWLQNHPIVLYESHLIEKGMEQILEAILKKNKFEKALLSQEGVQTEELGRIRLMGDSDILYLMKNLKNSEIVEEYFNRNKRKHPIWKTEEEFQAIFSDRQKELEIIEDIFDKLKTFLRSTGLPFVINADALGAVQSELNELKEEKQSLIDKGLKGSMEYRQIQANISDRENLLRLIKIFETFHKEQKIAFEFLVIYTKQFISGFRKQEFGNIELRFPELKKPCCFGKVSNVLKANESRAEKFFFLYYTSENTKVAVKKKISITSLVQKLIAFAGEIDISLNLN